MSRFRSTNSNNILYSDASMSPGIAVTAAAERITTSKIKHSHKYSPSRTGAGLMNSSSMMLRHYFLFFLPAPVFKHILSPNIHTGSKSIGSSSAMQEEMVIFGAAASIAPCPGFDCLLTNPNPVFNPLHPNGQLCRAEAAATCMCAGHPAFFSNIPVDSTRKDGITDTITPIPIYSPFQVSSRLLSIIAGSGACCPNPEFWYLHLTMTAAAAPVFYDGFDFLLYLPALKIQDTKQRCPHAGSKFSENYPSDNITGSPSRPQGRLKIKHGTALRRLPMT